MSKRAVHILVAVCCIAAMLSGCSTIMTTETSGKEKADRIKLSASLKPRQPETIEDVPVTQNEDTKEEAEHKFPEEVQVIEAKTERPEELPEPEKTTETTAQTDREKENEAQRTEALKDNTRTEESERENPPKKEPGVIESVKPESGTDVEAENRRPVSSPFDRPPIDTITYIPSRKEEKVETHQVESVVDEDDPSTYQIIQREQETETIEEQPVEYINPSGDVRYRYLDGIWYEYRYSSGDVTLDEKDEDLALFLLNIDGSYDEFEIEDIDCMELQGEDGTPQYSYHVRYRKTSVLEKAPEDTQMLTVVGVERTKITQVEMVEEKVPVLIEETRPTGEWLYYGWQTIDDERCYYDTDAKRVTGAQVIRGVRYGFNEDGVLTNQAGVIVSSEDGEIDWEAVREAGITSAYLRCAYRGLRSGTLILDTKLEENLAGAKEAGIRVGLYLYSQAVTPQEAIEEADLILLLSKQHQVEEPLVLSLAPSTADSSGRADRLSKEERTALAEVFCKTVQRGGCTPMIQIEKDWMENSLNQAALLSYPLWLIQYGTEDMDAVSAQIWQYTTKGAIDGIAGPAGLFIICGG